MYPLVGTGGGGNIKKNKIITNKNKIVFSDKKFISFKKLILHYESGLEVIDTSLKKLTQGATSFKQTKNFKRIFDGYPLELV